jgi:hypothetical protein
VPVVYSLGVVDELKTLATKLDTLAEKLDTIAGRLAPAGKNIYDQLHDVKGSVDVRVMDSTGEVPIESDPLTGLLVKGFVGTDPPVHHVIVDSGTISVGTPHVVVDNTVSVIGSVGVNNTPHVIVDSGTTTISNVPHVIVDSGTISADVTNVPHVVVDSGSVGINNVVHVIVDSGVVSITGTPTVYARQQAWGIVGKAWYAVRGMDHTFYQTLVNNTHNEWSDADTCSLIAIQSGMSSTNTSYANGLGSDAVGTNRYRSFVQADAT